MVRTRRGMLASAAAALALLSWASRARAQKAQEKAQGKAQAIQVSRVWSRPTPRSAPTGVIYMDIRNAGTDDVSVTAITTEAAARAEIHRTVRTDNIARMEKAGPVRIPPGETVSLKPDGLHVMMMDLSAQLVTGRAFAATLVFDDGSSVTVNVDILARTPPQPGHH